MMRRFVNSVSAAADENFAVATSVGALLFESPIVEFLFHSLLFEVSLSCNYLSFQKEYFHDCICVTLAKRTSNVSFKDRFSHTFDELLSHSFLTVESDFFSCFNMSENTRTEAALVSKKMSTEKRVNFLSMRPVIISTLLGLQMFNLFAVELNKLNRNIS